MIKLTSFLLVLGLSTFSVHAENISVDEALSVAKQFANRGASQHRIQGESDRWQLADQTQGHYIFQREQGGFVIVSARADAEVQVLGFSESGTFSTENPMFNAWVNSYDVDGADILRSASQHRAATHTNIPVLVSCQWGQDAPYSNLCPTRCPTGCTATATAQIMYFHKYPEKGTGSISYTSGSRNLSADFSQSTYNWGAMLDKTTSSSPAESKSAVALLMKDVGYGSQMLYQTSESVAYLYNAGYALATYFSYDKGVNFCIRRMYSDDEWDSLIYSELAAGRPVVYSGYSEDGSSGHTFVCDGYKDGYYHINWGWDGMNDGFFALDALQHYNHLQEALIGIQPDQGTTAFPTTLYNFADFTTEKSSYSKTENVKFMGQFVNRSLEAKTFRYGVEFVRTSDGTSTFVESTKDNERAPLQYYENYQVSTSLFPTKTGSYNVFPAYRDQQGEWHRMRTDNNKVSFVTCKVAFSKVTFTAGTVGISEVSLAPASSQHSTGIYSLDGRPLNSIPQKGMYIENGKKRMR